MSSKRNIRKQQCGRKHRHPTMEAAQAEAYRLDRLYGEVRARDAFYCHYCGGYHTGRNDVRLSNPHGAKFGRAA